MRITCPECGFSRDVPDEKVPATTAVATCPKCRHRFRFRQFEDGYEPVASTRASSPPGSRLAGEGGGGYRPRAGLGTTPRFPAATSHVRDYDPPGEPDEPAQAPQEAFSGHEPHREHGRGFPPPSAHWEPAVSPQDDTPDPQPVALPRPAPHPAVEDLPPRPKHANERLRVDERAAATPHAETRPDAEQEQNGVRDIWARLQAMDDEDATRQPSRPAPAPPRPTPVTPTPPPTPQNQAPATPPPSPAPRSQAPVTPPPPATPPREVAVREPEAGQEPVRAMEPEDQAGPAQAPAATEASPTGPEPAREPEDNVTDEGTAEDGGETWPPRAEDRPSAPAQNEVPWERPDIYGFFPGLVLTLKAILFQPVEFFETMPPGRGKAKAMVFNLLLSEFLLLVDFVWSLLGVRAKLADTGQTDALATMAGMPGFGFLILLIMVPVFIVAGIYLDAGLTHLLLALLRGTSRKFDETFRVMCYSAAPTVLTAVPVAGQLLSPVILIWYMTLQAIGLKKVHGAAYSQALAVVLIKWSLYLFMLLWMLRVVAGGA